MYEKFYHLNADPFCLIPDPRFSYFHPSFNKARKYMYFTLHRGEGFLLITGLPGTGKTTLVKGLLDKFAFSQYKVTTLVTTQLEADDLLRSVAYSYDLPVENANKATVIQCLKKYLLARHINGKHTILVVDEAQDLAARSLEELRLLTNLECNNHNLLQIFLVGQPQLYQTLGMASMEQLRQRITVAAAINTLTPDEVRSYILHRLMIADWHHDPEISDDVYQLIFENSGGVPRRINKICSRLFLHGLVENKHSLTLDDINLVLKELGEEQDLLLRSHFDQDLDVKKGNSVYLTSCTSDELH
jgi:type II secretory pathway predicted ATPase ExeA